MRGAFFSVLALSAIAAAQTPDDGWTWSLETGYLWGLKTNTDLKYEIVPTQLVLRSPLVWSLWNGGDGAEWLVRSRFALIAETITRGPENYYFGVSAAPSLEYRFPTGATASYLAIGGGAGWTDSAGGRWGQGQDLTLNWFGELGLRHQLSASVSISGGLFFLHHSNGGRTSPNPGIDALGFTVGAGWKF